MRRASLVVLALFSCLISIPIYSQSTSLPSQSTPPPGPKKPVYEPAAVLKVTTRLVVLDVVATDRHGHPVTDLQAKDFTVSEDGKQQQLRVFNLRRTQVVAATTGSKKLPRLPANIFTNIPSYSQSSSLNIILLDLLNTDFQDQAYARQRILKYLANIPDGEPIAVAVYVLGKKLRLVQDFTSDFPALRNVIKGVNSDQPIVADSATVGSTADNPDLVAVPPMPVKEFANVYEGPQQLDRRLQYTLDGLSSLAHHLAGYPGRKNLIWVSTTFPLGIAPDPEQGPNEFENLRDYEQAIVSVSQTLVDAQVAVYPVDPRGPLGISMYGGQGSAPSDQSGSLQGDSASGDAEHSTMKRVAQLTGGKAYFNQNDIDDAIRSSIEDGSTYYTLGYYPDNKDWNGRFRKIEAKVNRHGIKLRYRPGYYALNTRATQDPRLLFIAFERALKLDSPMSTGLRFEVGMVQPSDKTQNKVLLNFALDPNAITFEKEDDGLQHAKVDCAVQAYTEKGQLVKGDANTLTVALDGESFRKTMQTFLLAHVYFDLAPGSYFLRLGVMDEHTGLIGTTAAWVTINAIPDATQGKTEEKKP